MSKANIHERMCPDVKGISKHLFLEESKNKEKTFFIEIVPCKNNSNCKKSN